MCNSQPPGSGNTPRCVIVLALIALFAASDATAQVFSDRWGSLGSGPGQFNFPIGIATDFEGFVYVTDELNHRIQKFDREGNFVLQWGGYGAGDGQFNDPIGIAVDRYGKVYVTDRLNNRVQVFAPYTPCLPGMTEVVPGVCFVTKWGTFGSGPGQFANPFAIAVEPPDAFGNIAALYVADTNNNRVQKFTLNGIFLAAWGGLGTGDGQFHDPRGIAVDASFNVYVSERINHRVQKFDRFGTFISKWGSRGSGNGQFNGPDGVDVDQLGNVYVADEFNSRIQKFTSNGTFLAAFGQLGSGPDDLRFVMDLAVDRNDPFGKIYIADGPNQRIQVLSYPDTDGDALLDVWETNGIDIDADGVIDFDLPALGASATHKDVFWEFDYVELHAPTPQAITDVVAAFASAPVLNPDNSTGISLHVIVDDQLPHSESPLTAADFALRKATYFGTSAERASANAAARRLARSMVYHYALIAHQDTSIGGWAELGGNDIALFKGGSDTNNSPSLADEEGVYMHELGHNLGLRHGGGDEDNCKPNYFSVMNYSWTSNWIVWQVPGYSRPLDFSREVNPTLDENNLDESAGVVTTSTSWLYTLYGGAGGPALISAANVPIDWNRDGDALDSGVVVDVNAINWCGGDLTTLQGFNDWPSLTFNFRETGYLAWFAPPDPALNPPDPPIHEITAALLESVVLPVRIDVKPADAGNTIAAAGRAILRVAIVSDTFDATRVDAASVTFGPNAARATESRLRDIDRDGDLDLELVFRTNHTGLACGQTSATLTARTLDGLTIEGTDQIRPVPCK